MFLSGALEKVGEVHHGTAVMDFLEQERERGITIKSACVSFTHQNHQINLIDTPGHADFNFEVERSLRVLDGALVIIDSSKGVEAQTHTVMRQANKYKIPKIFILNKMDKPGADIENTLEEIKDKFNITPLNLFIPIIAGSEFIGSYNIVSQESLFWTELSKENLQLENKPQCDANDGELILEVDQDKYMMFVGVTPENLPKATTMMNHKINLDSILSASSDLMDELIDALNEEFPEVLDIYLEDKIDKYRNNLPKMIAQLLKKNPNKFGLCIPTSALKFKNIQPVLDWIVDYLPLPKTIIDDFDQIFKSYQSNPMIKKKQNQNSIKHILSKSTIFFIFKRQIDPVLGHVAFGRLYLGDIKNGMMLKAVYSNTDIKLGGIYRIRADEMSQISEGKEGDILCVTVPENIKSGDFLISSLEPSAVIPLLPEKYSHAKPVFITSVNFENIQDKQYFIKLIENL